MKLFRFSMNGQSMDLLRRLRELNVTAPVIVITAHGDIPLAVEAMRMGAADFLEKPFEDEVLLASVRSALDRGDRDQKRQAERSDIQSRLAGLSNRERDVLQGLVAGRANKQIAYDLGISARTIENYRANLMTYTLRFTSRLIAAIPCRRFNLWNWRSKPPNPWVQIIT